MEAIQPDVATRHWRVSREWRVSILGDPQEKWEALKAVATEHGGLYVPAAKNKTASVSAGFLFRSQEIAIQVAREMDAISPH